ncbi:alginate lyase family protein [Lutibacter sp. HS1-25]|uniref:alginate lyase family protein n=1 Tax=Lutibacter sp. HS1-25 TaxID=2485000 RepID=UPI0013E90F52|nr:alginate lyase family protein [Lutibacter sp. HS1-25]
MIQNTFKICFVSLFILIAINFKTNAQIEQNSAKKTLSVLDYNKLVYVKENKNSTQFSSLYKQLLEDADKALHEGPFSVVDKTQIPPSGSKHDYISLGPYWWPDPNKSDGLPWIRRDGEINPLTRGTSTDETTKDKMFHNTNTLAMAYFFSDKKQYAKKALELLKVWFVNEDTKMNPNLDFAQGIPGLNTGRGIGIIEFAGITNIIAAIEILELSKEMDAETSKSLRLWFSDYLNWLQTSENGIFEKNTKNNHATHYDTQIVSILLFLNRDNEAKEVLEAVKTLRIAKQIQPNGEQPHELERTKAMSYSTMNLKGFTELAFLGKKVNVDLWNYEAENGASIKKAYEFLKPYAEGKKDWNYKQIGDLDKAQHKLKQLFVLAGSEFNVEAYCKIGLDKDVEASSLLYFCN